MCDTICVPYVRLTLFLTSAEIINVLNVEDQSLSPSYNLGPQEAETS
jgi:hypothetical protein